MMKGNRYQFLWVLFLWGYFVVYAENDLQQDLCKKFEMMDPNASQKSYLSLAQGFREAKITLCDCLKAKNSANIARERTNLSREWNISEKQWKDIENIKTEIALRDAQSGTVAIESPFNLPDEAKNNLLVPFQEANFKNGVIKVVPENSSNSLEITRSLGVNIDYGPKTIKLGNLTISPSYQVGLSYAFTNYSDNAQMGNIIQRTKGHVAYQSNIEQALVAMSACLNKKADKSVVARSSSFAGYNKALENRADEVPAACGINSRDATLIAAWLTDLSKYEKIDQSRLNTVKRIQRFKQEEEQLR